MTSSRSSLAVLDALAPEVPLDDARLARARAEVEWAILEGGESRLARRARTARRSRRIVGLTAAAFGVVAVLTVAPVLTPDHRGSHQAAPLGLPGAVADGMGCDEYLPMPGPYDPDNFVAPTQWSHLPGLDAALFGLGGQSADHQWVTTGDARCDTDPPVAVLYSPDGRRGITVYRDVQHRFDKVSVDDIVGHAIGSNTTVVQGHAARYVTPPYGLHYMTWVDEAGIRWWVDANGMSMTSLVATLDDVIGPDGVASVPAGYEDAPVPKEPTKGLVYRWQQEYGSAWLEVTSPARLPVQAVASRQKDVVLTTFDGHDAFYLKDAQGGSLLGWNAGGATFRLTVPDADVEQLKALAATIVPLDLPAD